MDSMIYFIEAKYHLAVAERLVEDYEEYPNKRFLIGAIKESAMAVSKLIRAFSANDGVLKNNYNNFLKNSTKILR